jgi:CDP-diglyceride synthetase
MALAVFEYSLIAVPPILLFWEWTRRFVRKQYPISLVLTTVSCLWILLGLLWRGAIGPDYSNLHGMIALVNLAVDLLCAIASIAVRSQRSLRIVIAAFSLAFVWSFILEIMYAV